MIQCQMPIKIGSHYSTKPIDIDIDKMKELFPLIEINLTMPLKNIQSAIVNKKIEAKLNEKQVPLKIK